MGSRLDLIYRSILQTKFFSYGWGRPENLKELFAFRKILSDREKCMKLVDPNHPITITKEIDNGDHIVIEAQFDSPIIHHLPNLVPKVCEKAYFQLVLPKRWKGPLKPTCLHLAGTGDHGFWRRRILMAKPLLQEAGIASIIHENPFYGLRKPADQWGSALRNVSDLFLMGGCLVLESMAIFHWAQKQGLGPLGITGISMGGHMASLAACSWDKPIPVVPCLSWSTASHVFTQGVLSGAVNWEALKHQYFSHHIFRDELFNMIHSPEGHFHVFHEVGQKFARDFPSSMKHVRKLEQSTTEESEVKSAEGKKRRVVGVDSAKLIFDSFKLTKITSKSTTKKADKSSVLLKYRKDKANISSPDYRKHSPSMDIRPSSAADSRPVTFEPFMNVRDSLTWEALQFMRGIMDECTHIGNFSVPVDPSLAIIVAASDDAYMPHDGVIPLTQLWPGSELRSINTGHISAFLFNQEMFRRAIKDSFDRTIRKYSDRTENQPASLSHSQPTAKTLRT